MIIRVTKEFRFEMAHALWGHDGPCSSIHGHSYQLSVTLKGHALNDPNDPKNGMVIDFSDLKRIVTEEIVRQFDHALVLNSDTDPQLIDALGSQKLILVDFQPSCENLCSYFAGQLCRALPDSVRLHHLLLRETATSYAGWYAEDNEYISL